MSSTYRRPLRAAALGLAALGAGAAAAAPAPPYPDLLAGSRASAPRLAEARAEVARADGLARQAAVFPNPSAVLEVENFAGSGPYGGGRLTESTLQLQQMLELGGKRAARAGAGRAEADAARARARQAEADYAFDLALAYAGAEAAQRRSRLALDLLALAEEDARIATVLVEAGREAEFRRLQAVSAVQAARASADEARAAEAAAFGALAAMAGASEPFTSVPVSLLDAERTLPKSSSPIQVTAYLSAQAAREAAARRLDLERRRAIPDLTASVGMRRFEEGGATAVVAGISAPLPLFDRNRGNIAAARAEVGVAEARLDAARLEAEAALRTSAVRTQAAETRLTAARDGEAMSAEAYRLARVGYEAGKLPLVELVSARRALVEARAQIIAAAVERVGAQAAQARLGGFAVSEDQP